ncbi:recombinase family protein [Cytobacillus purgationiresistens]
MFYQKKSTYNTFKTYALFNVFYLMKLIIKSSVTTISILQSHTFAFPALTVQRVFDLKEQYSLWSLTKIAEQLNKEGHQTKQGKLFTKVQIKRILDRKAFYSGSYRYGEKQHMANIKPFYNG